MTVPNVSSGDAFLRVVNALQSLGMNVNVHDEKSMAQCPAHDDENPSLSIAQDEDRVLIHCHAGCPPEDVVDALGLTMADLYDRPTARTTTTDAREPVHEYIYQDEAGSPLFRVVRLEPKGFRQQRWNGTDWDRTLGDARRVLYRLPELLAGIAASQWVFVVEGEKDAERLAAEGFTATTIAMGSNTGNWDKTETTVLDGAFVAVIADNDAPGRKYAKHVANSLTGRAAQVRLIRLSGLPDGGDVSDWLDSGNTAADLGGVVESTPQWRPRRKFDGAKPFVTVGDVSVYTADSLRQWARKPVPWRIRGVLVKGTHLVVGAAKKTLKTTLVSGEMAFAIANDAPWLGHKPFEVEAPAPVVVIINEGAKSYMRSLDRIPDRYGADSLGSIYVIEASGLNVNNGDLNAVIRETVERVGAEVIIYDAWYGFVGGDAEASNLFSMSDVFKIVQDVADELDIDPVIVHHLKKRSKGRPDLDDLTFAGVAEWADSWLLIVHREEARSDEGEYRLGLVAASRQWGGFDYEIDASFGQVDLANSGYTQTPQWQVIKVTAEQSQWWGKKPASSTTGSETSLADFITAHPFEYTKSQVSEEAPGGEKANRKIVERLIENGTLSVVQTRRPEGNRTVLRSLVGPTGTTPAAVEQRRLAPIRNDLPTFVGDQGAGNSPEAAVSASSEPPAGSNIGNAADVDNPDIPTVSDPTPAATSIDSRSSTSTGTDTEATSLPRSHDERLCDDCGEPQGHCNWECFIRQSEQVLAAEQDFT